jgi:hypothetical protein
MPGALLTPRARAARLTARPPILCRAPSDLTARPPPLRGCTLAWSKIIKKNKRRIVNRPFCGSAPGARETLQQGGGRRPPPCWRVSKAPGPARPQKHTQQIRPDCLQVPSFSMGWESPWQPGEKKPFGPPKMPKSSFEQHVSMGWVAAKVIKAPLTDSPGFGRISKIGKI